MSTVLVVTRSTFSPARNVRSTEFPLARFLSLVRTNAPPLPGLTCWNCTTLHSSPSRSRTYPFLRSLVVIAIVLRAWCSDGGRAYRCLRGMREHPRPVVGDHDKI